MSGLRPCGDLSGKARRIRYTAFVSLSPTARPRNRAAGAVRTQRRPVRATSLILRRLAQYDALADARRCRGWFWGSRGGWFFGSGQAAHARKLGCHRVDVGGVADHVHVLVSLPATLSVADLVGQLKGVSSHLVNHVLAPTLGFRWQGSYGAFTVGQPEYAAVRDYVNDQPAHHGEGTTEPQWEVCARPQPHDDGAS